MSTDLSQWIADLSHSDAKERQRAAEQRARLGPDAVGAAIPLARGSGDESAEVREWCMAALEELGPPAPDDLPGLVELLKSKQSDVSYWAATLLGRLQGEGAPATEALAGVLSSTRPIAIRHRAAWALGEIGPRAQSAIPVLQEAAQDADPRLARLARQSLERIEGK